MVVGTTPYFEEEEAAVSARPVPRNKSPLPIICGKETSFHTDIAVRYLPGPGVRGNRFEYTRLKPSKLETFVV